MKVRFARVTVESPGSESARRPHTAPRRARGARARPGAKLATAIVYPYVAEPVRQPASPSSWPFALATPLPSLKPEQDVVQVRAPELDTATTDHSPARPLHVQATLRAATTLPIKAPPIQVPPPAGHTEPPPAPPLTVPEVSEPPVAAAVEASPPTEPTAEVASPPQPESPVLLESEPAAFEAAEASEAAPEPPAATVEASPPVDLQPAASDPAADGGAQPEPSLDRTSRARIVERLWEDPIREELEVNLGATTESNLYVDFDLQVANGGVFVATYQHLPPGTPVSLHITLAGGLATSAHGRVTLKRESLEGFGDPAPGVCVAFELLSNEALALLEQFAAIRAPLLIEDD